MLKGTTVSHYPKFLMTFALLCNSFIFILSLKLMHQNTAYIFSIFHQCCLNLLEDIVQPQQHSNIDFDVIIPTRGIKVKEKKK